MLEEGTRTDADQDSDLISVATESGTAYVSVRRLAADGDEAEIAARIPSFDEVITTVLSLAKGAADRMRATGASKVSLEFGCEIGVESGQLAAIVAKASGKATFKVGLEWSDSKPAS